MWFWAIVIAVIIGGLIGMLTSKDGERKESAFAGALVGGMGCIQVLLYIFFTGFSIFIVIFLFRACFG